MTEVVLLFAKEDVRAAKAVVNLLRRGGVSAQALSRINGAADGAEFDHAVNGAGCVVALWSSSLLRDPALIDYARAADRRRALVSASLDGSEPPADIEALHATAFPGTAAKADPSGSQALFRAVRETLDRTPEISREDFLRSFFFFGGLHFGNTLDDVIKRFGLPSESSESWAAYENSNVDGPGLFLVQTHPDTKLIGYVVVHGKGGIDFLARHEVVDPRLAFIGMHKDEIFKILGAPTQNLGEFEDGRVVFGYHTLVGVEATAPDGESARFGLVIYVLFYLTSRDIPFCVAMSVQWDPVPLPETDGETA
jgi:hypothetical protein